MGATVGSVLVGALVLLGESYACVSPGQCTPPTAQFSRVALGPAPGIQWEISGGFCGSWSMQQAALAHGAWISQDLVRKANRDWPGGPKVMHGDSSSGYEVIPTNVAYTAQQLKLRYSQWNFNATKPQASAFKRWIKQHLVRGDPVLWFPMCKGDRADGCYGGGGCPNGGNIDHVEPIYGIFSNHSLSDPTVYDDDVILHASDQDMAPYYRAMNTLEDSPDMQGNCASAQPWPGRNEMYPCFDASVTYGLAVTGIQADGTLPTSITVNQHSEPNVRFFRRPSQVLAVVHVSGLEPGQAYTVYRYNSTRAVPVSAPFDRDAMSSFKFIANESLWSKVDPTPFQSDTAVYWVTVKGA